MYHDRFAAYCSDMDGDTLCALIMKSNRETADFFIQIIQDLAKKESKEPVEINKSRLFSTNTCKPVLWCFRKIK